MVVPVVDGLSLPWMRTSKYTISHGMAFNMTLIHLTKVEGTLFL